MNSVEGLPELIKKFADMQENGMRMANAVMGAIADGIVNEAKQSAPADLGTIRQNIGKRSIRGTYNISYIIFSAAPESAFQEFGTGGKVDVPSDMADIASQFQGAKGEGMAAFIQALTDWVKRHGLTGVYSIETHKRSNAAKFGGKQGNADEDERVAWLIARSILKNGLKPQPFLYPAYVNGVAKIIPTFEKAIDDLTFSFNNNKSYTKADSDYY